MKVLELLRCSTPSAWIESAAENLPLLLVDHANCEKKAAGAAMNLMYRYIDKPEMMMRLSKLAREELRHFEQVLAIMQQRGVEYVHVSPSRYAGELRKTVRTFEPARLVDILCVSAIVEARSCERFACLVPVLDDELAGFYQSLLKSESRHASVYTEMAMAFTDKEDVESRMDHFLEIDESLVTSPDPEFRFHSGRPA